MTALATYREQHNDQLGLSKARLYRIATLNQPENLIYHFIEEMLDEGQLQQTRELITFAFTKNPIFS